MSITSIENEAVSIDWVNRPLIILSRDIRLRKTNRSWIAHFRADAPANFGLEIGSEALRLLCSFDKGARLEDAHESILHILRAFADPGFLVPLEFKIEESAISFTIDEVLNLRDLISTDLIGLLELESIVLAALVAQNESSAPVCELGSLLGGSTILIAKMIKNRNLTNRVLAIDDHVWHEHMPGKQIAESLISGLPSSLKPFISNLEAAEVSDIVDIVVQDTARAAGSVGQPISLLFMDASHHFKGLQAEFEAWFPHLIPGCYLVIHDYGNSSWPEVKTFVQQQMRFFDRFNVFQTVAVARKRFSD